MIDMNGFITQKTEQMIPLFFPQLPAGINASCQCHLIQRRLG